MIKWENLSLQEVEVIGKIAKRAHRLYPDYSLMNLDMDISAAHLDVKLNLAEFVRFDEFNFKHDVAGIVNNLNRQTGKIENCFLPRCSD